MGIYVHIPFCVRKCNYCDFLSGPAEPKVREQYVKQLIREINSFPHPEKYRAVSVFFGGGTPSLLEGEALGSILQALGEQFPQVRAAADPEKGDFGQEKGSGKPVPEITVECNPGTLTRKKLEQYKKWGVNRLSIGLQSTEDKELRLLGRIHTWEEFLENYQAAREAGFSNINIDLMSGLPGQSAASWRETLRKVLALKPEHISAYSLIVEEGTVFDRWYGQPEGNLEVPEAYLQGQPGQSFEAPGECLSGQREQCVEAEAISLRIQEKGEGGAGRSVCRGFPDEKLPPLPPEEEERQMYYDTEELLRTAGMERYEISNYARPGCESIHNSGYWVRREYAGFGLGASSQLGHVRYKNTDSLKDYLRGDFSRQEVEELTRKDEMEETMFLGLRMMQGVDREEFFQKFQIPLEEVYSKQIRKLKKQGLLEEQGNRLRLTGRGIDVSNGVLAEFLLD